MCLQLPKSILPLQSRGENLETGVWLNLPAAEGSPCCLVELAGRMRPHPSLTPGTLRAGLHRPLSPLVLCDGPGSLGSPCPALCVGGPRSPSGSAWPGERWRAPQCPAIGGKEQLGQGRATPRKAEVRSLSSLQARLGSPLGLGGTAEERGCQSHLATYTGPGSPGLQFPSPAWKARAGRPETGEF